MQIFLYYIEVEAINMRVVIVKSSCFQTAENLIFFYFEKLMYIYFPLMRHIHPISWYKLFI